MKIKGVFLAAILTAVLCFSSTVLAGTYSGGDGTAEDPYQIADANDLLELAATTADYNKSFILTADIDLDPNLPSGQVWTTAIIAPDMDNSNDYNFDGTAFTGTFDGSGHKITNFTINGNDYLGLFGKIDAGGKVKNLGLENCTVSCSSGSWFVGGLAGENSYSSISDCYSTGTVNGDLSVGGLVGVNYSGTLTSCYATGSVSGNYYYVGGLVGLNSGSISNCYSMGAVSGSGEVGGLVGYNNHRSYPNESSLTGCYATGSVSGTSNVGGLVGLNVSSISNCYSRGTVSGTSNVGGLVGDNHEAITNCYSTGGVTGDDYVGGLVGSGEPNLVTTSFWDKDASGQTTSAGGTGKTTAEMKQINTFANWDFAETWGIEDNQTYPFLKLTYPVGDLNHDKVVNFLDFAILAEHWLEGID